MPSPSEKELEHYRVIVELIYEGKPTEKARLNTGAKLVIAEIKRNLPTADDQTIRSFMASIGYMAAGLSNLRVREIGEMLEATFDQHMLAVASMLGLVDLDEGEDSGPTVDELIARRNARETEYFEAMRQTVNDDNVPGQYL